MPSSVIVVILVNFFSFYTFYRFFIHFYCGISITIHAPVLLVITPFFSNLPPLHLPLLLFAVYFPSIHFFSTIHGPLFMTRCLDVHCTHITFPICFTVCYYFFFIILSLSSCTNKGCYISFSFPNSPLPLFLVSCITVYRAIVSPSPSFLSPYVHLFIILRSITL